MMKHITENPHVDDAFERIIGTRPPTGFGEPFIHAFARTYKGEKEETVAAAYICSLFLSAILEGYPTGRLHTFVHHIQENYSRFSFNCDMYEAIFKEMDTETCRAVCLLQKENTPVRHTCSKEDIFEAFDFYTNR